MSDTINRARMPFVETGRVKAFLKRLDLVMSLPPEEATLLPLLGPSRCGKSAICEELERRYPAYKQGRQTIRPVVYIGLSVCITFPNFVAEILTALGDPDPYYGGISARIQRLRKALQAQGVKLLIIDEVQQLIDSDTQRIAFKAADLFKTILNFKLCHVIMSGLTHGERILDTNSQIELRSLEPTYFTHHDWRNPDDQKDWRGFLHLLDVGLELPSRSGLGSKDTAFRIHYHAQGRLGVAVRLIEVASQIRKQYAPDRACLDFELLGQAAEQLGYERDGKNKKVNPFQIEPPGPVDPAPMYEQIKQPRTRRTAV